MEWQIHSDGYYYIDWGWHAFELGEMGWGHWVLKHWAPGAKISKWYEVTSADKGKTLAERLAAE